MVRTGRSHLKRCLELPVPDLEPGRTKARPADKLQNRFVVHPVIGGTVIRMGVSQLVEDRAVRRLAACREAQHPIRADEGKLRSAG